LKRTLENIELDFFQKSSTDSSVASPMTARVNRMRWLAIAASLALVAAAYWFLKAPSLPEYQQFAQHAPLSLTVRGVADQIGSAAEIAFEKKDYAQALTLLNQLLAESPNDSNLQLYKGICLLETDQAAQARSTWEPITNGQSALRSEAQWYTALSYLKEQNYASCKSALLKIQPNEDRYEDAQKLLKQLN
jgi:tetratricopeptide (TPR) repeat protein